MEDSEETSMTPNEILKVLNEARVLPAATLESALACREVMVPLFLGEFEKYLALSPEERQKAETWALFYGFHLLGEWREKSAYRTMARLLRLPSDEAVDFFGDAATETAHRVMASLFDGDQQPLIDIILDDKAYDAIRSRMFDTLIILVRENLLSRENLAAFLRKTFDKLQSCNNSFVWDGWVSAVSTAGFEDMTPLVKRAFDEGRLEEDLMDFEDFEKDLQHGLSHPYHPHFEGENEYTFWKNTVDEFLSWSGMSNNGNDKGDEDWEYSNPTSHINHYRDVGRNDPCPCGSGKKFKKCCGG